MHFHCSNCNYKKQLSAQQSKNYAGKKIACPKCKKSTRLPKESEAEGSRWFIFNGEVEHGPIADKEIYHQLAKGWILPEFLVKHDEITDGVWKPVMEVNELARKMPASAVAGGGNASPTPPPMDTPSLVTPNSSSRQKTLTGLPAAIELLLGLSTVFFFVMFVLVVFSSFFVGDVFKRTNNTYNDAIRDSMRSTNNTFNEELRRSMRETQRTYNDALKGY